MTYRITGLDPAAFAPLSALDDAGLAARGVVRMTVTDKPGFPCRITLDDAEPGASVLLLNHVSIAAGPYAARHAIFVSAGPAEAAVYEDRVPPALDRRKLSLRAFDSDDLMVDALLVEPGAADGAIRRLFDNPAVRYIHAHNAVRGCFAAAVERA
ncbi:DUF1203 domain-containing protein [Sphingomonas astaxanthinifaciens]|nr:DUF1203 domain-containing protein [Sphingomonas astaxanthinifaciens]